MEQFGDFTASELYCPKCRAAKPVRERLLLVLPNGELHEYVCSVCGGSLGKRTVSAQPRTAKNITHRKREAVPRRLLG